MNYLINILWLRGKFDERDHTLRAARVSVVTEATVVEFAGLTLFALDKAHEKIHLMLIRLHQS